MPTLFRHAAPTLIALATLAATCAPAQANLLSNGSFEAAGPNLSGTGGSYCYLGFSDYRACGAVPGWTGTLQIIAANSGAWGNPSGNGGLTSGLGSRIAGLQNNSYMEQTLTLAAGTYTLSWLDSNRKGYGLGNSYQVLVDDTALATYNTTLGEAWAANSLSFTTTAGNHTLRLKGLRTTGDGTSFVDGLSLTAQVPEPASLALVALALAGVAASRRRRA